MTAIAIIGMHRSGTSCVTGSLQNSGLFAGDVVESAPFNKKGNRENLEIRSINDEVLSYSKGAWNNPPENIAWSEALSQKRNRIIEKFYMQAKAWLFKDPRTTLTLPFWREAINDLVLLGIFRQPIAVAQSLEYRGKIAISESIRIWCIYNERILLIADKQQFPLLSFDLPQIEFIQQMEKAVSWLSTKLKNKVELKIELCRIFYDKELKHHDSYVSAEVVMDKLYRLLPQDEKLAQRASKIYIELNKKLGTPKF